MVAQVWFEPPFHEWGLLVGVYLFLEALAGGAFATGFFADLLGGRDPSYRKTALWGMVTAFLAIVIGAPILLSHLGAPTRALLFPVLFTNFSSWMTVGVWVIVLFALVALAQLVWMYLDRSAFRAGRWALGIIGLILGVVLMVYTAELLSTSGTIPLWHPTLLPLLFLASGFSTGIAAALIPAMYLGGTRDGLQAFSLVIDAFIVIELVGVVLLLQFLETADTAAAATLGELNTELAVYFWGLFVAVGLVAPLALSLLLVLRGRQGQKAGSRLRYAYTAQFGLVLLGGFVLRMVVLYAAVKQPLQVF